MCIFNIGRTKELTNLLWINNVAHTPVLAAFFNICYTICYSQDRKINLGKSQECQKL